MSRSASSLSHRLRVLLDVVLVVALGLAALDLLLLLGLSINPTHPIRRLLTITTLYRLPIDLASVGATVTCRDPLASVEADPMAYVTFRPGSRLFLIGAALSITAWWGLWLTVVFQLRWIFDAVCRGEPFLPSSVRRIRIAGWAGVGAALFEPLWELAVVVYMRSILTIAGAAPFPPLALIANELPLGTLFAGVIVLALAQIFRVGARLQEEQALTI